MQYSKHIIENFEVSLFACDSCNWGEYSVKLTIDGEHADWYQMPWGVPMSLELARKLFYRFMNSN